MKPIELEPESVIDTTGLFHQKSALRLFRAMRTTSPEQGVNRAGFSVLGRLYQEGLPPPGIWLNTCVFSRNQYHL